MSFQKGWINRQFARVEREAQNWPTWMQRDTETMVNIAESPTRASGQQEKNDSPVDASDQTPYRNRTQPA
jgi:hypothetical protein